MRFTRRINWLVAALWLAAGGLGANGQEAGAGPGLNEAVLAAVEAMPPGGGFATTHDATVRLQESVQLTGGRLLMTPMMASPTYCSGATYLVFLRVIQDQIDKGALQLDEGTLEQLTIRGQADGRGIWGRWNANGPGTARLFHELGLGRNFTSFAEAQPGDFMKVFWTQEVGSTEHGHSVVFMGMERRADGDYVKIWSSNKPMGYSVKSVAMSKISRAIFSRLEKPENLAKVGEIPASDSYLSSLQTRRSSWEEAGAKCGF